MLDELLRDLQLELVPLSIKQAAIARDAYLSYSKGQKHKAQLNYGDVMAYALAKDYGETLVCVGDFKHTDLKTPALPLAT